MKKAKRKRSAYTSPLLDLLRWRQIARGHWKEPQICPLSIKLGKNKWKKETDGWSLEEFWGLQNEREREKNKNGIPKQTVVLALTQIKAWAIKIKHIICQK